MKINASEEMYLETILVIYKRKHYVRSVDIVEERGLAKSSVSRAVNLLKSRGLVTIEKDGRIEFTEEGAKKAASIYERHCFLTEMLMKTGVSKEIAEDNACRIEHVITEELFNHLKYFVNSHCKNGIDVKRE